MSQLRVTNLEKSYDDEVAAAGLSIELKKGEFKTLLGPSGCGKTTTLRCIAGLEEPDGGEMYINDKLVSSPGDGVHTPSNKRDIGMVFQSYAVWPHMTVAENIRFPLDEQNIGTKQERKQQVADMVETIGLEVHADDLASNLSGGQQQRVALARALITDPELLLLDEPLSNLDAKLRREMRNEIKALANELDITVLYVTHSQDEALYLSDKIALMNDGNIVEEGTPSAVLSDPEKLFTMNFMGRCNMISGTVEAANSPIVVDSPLGSIKASSDKRFSERDEVFVAFRPQHALIKTPETAANAGVDRLEFNGTIERTGLTQEMVEYLVDIQGVSVTILSQNDKLYEEGDEVDIVVARDKIKLYLSDGAEKSDLTIAA